MRERVARLKLHGKSERRHERSVSGGWPSLRERGDDRFTATAGSFVFLPRGIVHGFTILGDTPLRGLVLTLPGGFDQFVTEMGEPALSRTIPAGGPPDMARLMALTAKYGIELQIPGA